MGPYGLFRLGNSILPETYGAFLDQFKELGIVPSNGFNNKR